MIRRAVSRILPKKARDALWYLRSKDLRLATAAARQLVERHGCVVIAGPFAGMKYVQTAFGSSYTPKLAGTYELELRGIMQAVSGGGYASVIDIGAAEGYYTVGLARMLPGARVVGYEMQTEAHPTLRELAENNGVAARVVIKGTCTTENLGEDLRAAQRTLIVSDCEGAESFLLDPQKMPALLSADVLVETHDFISAGVTDLLRKRFEKTHEVEVITCELRKLEDWPVGADFVPEKYRLAAMAEHRGPGQVWLWMRRK